MQQAMEVLASGARGAVWLELLSVGERIRVGRVAAAGEGSHGSASLSAQPAAEALPDLWPCRRRLPLNGLVRHEADLVGLVTVGDLVAGIVRIFQPARRAPYAERLSRLRRAIDGLPRPLDVQATWVVGEDGSAVLWAPEEFDALPGPLNAVPHDGWCQRGPETLEVRTLQGDVHPRFIVSRRPARWVEICPLHRLSETQLQVAEYAAAGATVVEIARCLSRSDETVKTHLREVYRRLGIASRVELAEVCTHVW